MGRGATINDNVLTLADIAKHKEPNGQAAKIIEILSLNNAIVQDAPAIECNNGTTHVTTFRDSIPRPTFRMLNQGTKLIKSSLRQITEHTGVMEAWQEVDQALLDLATNSREVLLNETKAILEGMSQAAAEALFYGDMALDPASFDGFTKRYNTLSATNPVSRNVIDAGGTSNNRTSIWLIQWDTNASHLLFPKGVTAGVKREVFTGQTLRDSQGDPFTGVMIHFYWYLGLAVRDWRRVVRICNVDVSELSSIIATGAPSGTTINDGAAYTLPRLLMYALDLLPNIGSGKTAFYMNRLPHTMLNMLCSEKRNVQLSYESIQGNPPIMTFLGTPIHRCDSLANDEPQVV